MICKSIFNFYICLNITRCEFWTHFCAEFVAREYLYRDEKLEFLTIELIRLCKIKFDDK